VMEPGGLLIVVIPGEGHLAELRDAAGLMGMEEDKEKSVGDRFSEAFRLVGRRTLEYAMRLEGPDVAALVEMTPNRRHVLPERLKALSGVEMEITASFVVLEFTRC